MIKSIFTLSVVLVLSVVCYSSDSIANSSAEDAASSQSQHDLRATLASRVNSPWSVYGGVVGGFGLSSTQNYTSSPQGGQFLLNSDVSYQLGRWVFDLGLGWYYSSVMGKLSDTQTARITTRAGLVELSPRYRIGDHWQLGPVASVLFGADTTYDPSISSAAAEVLVGVKGVYELPLEYFNLRFFAQLAGDVSGGASRAYFMWVGAQIGLPIGIASTTSGDRYGTRNSDRSNETVTVTLDPQRVFFGTSSARLNPGVGEILKDLGKYLENHEANAETEILGHADQRGKFEYNLKLSKLRAESVKNAMLEGGIDSKKVDLQAFSYLHPLVRKNTPDAWTKNRRVEIIFNHVENPEALKEKLKPLVDPSVNIGVKGSVS